MVVIDQAHQVVFAAQRHAMPSMDGVQRAPSTYNRDQWVENNTPLRFHLVRCQSRIKEGRLIKGTGKMSRSGWGSALRVTVFRLRFPSRSFAALYEVIYLFKSDLSDRRWAHQVLRSRTSHDVIYALDLCPYGHSMICLAILGIQQSLIKSSKVICVLMLSGQLPDF